MRVPTLTMTILVGVFLPQWLMGPTLAGAGVSVLALVYAFAFFGPPFSRSEARRVASRASGVVGGVVAFAYGAGAATGLYDLPYVGFRLALASSLVGLVAAGFVCILAICGLDAAATGRGGYAEETSTG
jgi:hypothetical protein